MDEPLRPSTLGEILDRTAQLYRRNFWLFAGTAAIPMLLIFVLMVPAVGVIAIPGIAGGANAGTPPAPARLAMFLLLSLIFIPVYLGFYALAIAAITQSAVSAHRGEKLTIRAALKSVRPRFWTYFGFLFLQAIMAAIVPLAIAVAVIAPLAYLVSRPGGGVGSSVTLGFAIFVVGAAALGAIIWLALSYAMGMAVCVVEKKTAWESLTRSMYLSRGTRGRIFVLFLLVMVLSMVVSTASYLVAIFVGALTAVVGHGTTAVAVATVIGGILYAVVSISAQIVLQPVSWIALVLFYYDQRIRKEGFDIEVLMEQAGMTQPQPAPPVDSGEIISAPATPPDTVEER